MTAKTWHSGSALMAAVLAACLASCGGSDSGPETPTPTPTPAPTPTPTPTPQPNAQFKFELLAGVAQADLKHCQSTDGPASEARFSYLERVVVYKDAIYLTETGGACPERRYFSTPVPAAMTPDQEAQQVAPKIRKLSKGRVETALSLYNPDSPARQRAMARYPGGFHRDEKSGAFYVAGYAATRIIYNYGPNSEISDWYDKAGAWNYFVPGIFKYEGNAAGENNLLAGMPGKKPDSFVDGRGKMAQFQAPHDLEADASGLLYVIDGGDDTRIRTISSNGEVKTLDGYRKNIRALDADRQGHIHALEEIVSGSSYVWHRLSDGSKIDFRLRPNEVGELSPRLRAVDAFTVVDDGIVLATHTVTGGPSTLYRVSSQGVATQLTGEQVPVTPQDFLEHPEKFRLPPVQHLKYGVDGNLYIVLEQGVLIARDFR